MKAPDKIYINSEIELEDGVQPWLHTPFNSHSILYISKDALLKWAKEIFENAECEGARNSAFQCERQDVAEELIDKLNSL